MFDEQEIRKAIAIMKPDGKLFEIRIIHNSGKKNYSGYFDNADMLISALKKVNLTDCNVYITLNPLNPACKARTQYGRFEQNAKTTTSDSDVTGWDWLFVDLDPKRPSGTSSSDEQLNKAKAIGNKIFQFMQEMGFENPITAFSGNGVHLLYRVNLENTAKNTDFMKKCLKTLDMLFGSDEIDIDLKTFNAARICKLYGTVAQKGANIPEFPHRKSFIIGNPENIKVSSVNYLKKLADLYPETIDQPARYNNYNGRTFDLEEWMGKHGLQYRKEDRGDVEKYILSCCPFDSNHKGKDACIFRARTGAIGFHCFHNSCADKTWKDVRVLFEPDAYDRQRQEYESHIYGHKNRDKPKEASKPIVATDDKPILYTAMDILKLPYVEEEFIRSGTKKLDKAIRGLKKGAVSVVSGMRGSAKSTLVSQWILNAINDGFRVGVYSGELTEKDFMNWMCLQAAGKQYVINTQYERFFTVEEKYRIKIAKWIGDRLYLYNNYYGNKFDAIIQLFEKEIPEKKIDMLIFDNLMSLDIGMIAYTKYDSQTGFVLTLTELAKKHDVHICFIAHPRKSQGFLRLEDISGTMDLGNAVDYAFIIHRMGHDFETKFKMEFGARKFDELGDATNILEITKDRAGGTQDMFIPLWYETESKRLKNDPAENRIYGWVDAERVQARKQAVPKQEPKQKEPEPPKPEPPRQEQAPVEPQEDDLIDIPDDINWDAPFD